MRSCEIHGAALFGHKIGGNVMNLGLNLSAVSFWQLAQRRTCKQMGRHATETVTLDITSFAGGGSLGRSGGRSVERSAGLLVAVVVGAGVLQFCAHLEQTRPNCVFG